MAPTSQLVPDDPLVGSTIGDEFKIESVLGAGGMGTVYNATQLGTNRAVAIKTVHRHLVDELLIRRFQQEAQIVAKLNHPNIVTVYKFGQHSDGTLYIAMEFADGKALDDLIVSGATRNLARVVPWMAQMADALAYAHEHKIVHRDIKPGNIMVAKAGRREVVKVLDFGIAKIVDDTHIVTKTGVICGSPEYMSPEQWNQVRDIDGRSDIYSLGCVFYSLLVGKPPFESQSVPGFMMQHCQSAPRNPIERRPELVGQDALVDIILRCLSKEREDRFEDAYELADALRAVDLSKANAGGAASSRIGAAGETLLAYDPEAEASRSGSGAAATRDPMAFLDAITFTEQDAPHVQTDTPATLGARHKTTKKKMAQPEEFDIDVAHTGPTGSVHRMLVAVGSILLLALAGTMIFLFNNPVAPAPYNPLASENQ